MVTEARLSGGQTKACLARVPISVAILALSALILSAIASGPGVIGGDVVVTRWVQGAPDQHLGSIFRKMNVIGETPVMLLIGAVLIVVCWCLRRLDALVLIAAATVARIANPILKAIVESPRPTSDRVRVEDIASGTGFPSGHVMGMTLLVGALVALAWTTWPGRLNRVATVMIAGFVLLMSGAGRITVGAHWPTDVIGGYLFGSLGVIGLVWCWRYGLGEVSTFVPHLIPSSLRTESDVVSLRPENMHSVMTMDFRRRIGAVALGVLLAGMVAYAAGAAAPLAQTPASTGTYAARIISGSCADTSAATAYDLKSVSLTGSDDDDNNDALSGRRCRQSPGGRFWQQR